jgi:hypothetical protein
MPDFFADYPMAAEYNAPRSRIRSGYVHILGLAGTMSSWRGAPTGQGGQGRGYVRPSPAARQPVGRMANPAGEKVPRLLLHYSRPPLSGRYKRPVRIVLLEVGQQFRHISFDDVSHATKLLDSLAGRVGNIPLHYLCPGQERAVDLAAHCHEVVVLEVVQILEALGPDNELPLGSASGLDMPCLINRHIMPKIIPNNKVTAMTPWFKYVSKK